MDQIPNNTGYFNDMANNIGRLILKFTPQLFIVKNHSTKLPPKPLSSSILITDNKDCFLITAGHAFYEEEKDNIGIMIQHDMCTIGGDFSILEPNSGDYFEPNNKDIAIFKLDQITIDALKEKGYEFLASNKILRNHYIHASDKYLIFGYPGERTKLFYPTKSIIPSSITIRTIPEKPSYYLKNNIDFDKIIVLSCYRNSFNNENIFTQKKLPPLDGISGCGVWLITNLFGKNPDYNLASIVTGEDTDQTVLFSTKLGFLFN